VAVALPYLDYLLELAVLEQLCQAFFICSCELVVLELKVFFQFIADGLVK